MKMTVAQFMQAHEVDRNKANSVLKFLYESDLITKAGELPAKGGKGRNSIVYDVPETVTLNFSTEGEMTVVQFTTANKVDRNKANSVLKFLYERGLITKAGELPANGGKGRNSIVYAVPGTVTLSLVAEIPTKVGAQEVAEAEIVEA